MTTPLLHDYVPLGLTFHSDANATPPPCLIGHVPCVNRASANYFLVSLALLPNGNVFCGDEESPDQPVRFVNTSVAALARYIEAHADYTNDTIYRCQLDGSDHFEGHFLREIGTLVAQFHAIDPEAIASRENWWPYILDPILAEFRRRINHAR